MPLTPRAKDILHQIADLLMDDPQAGVELWSVLSALRGPDLEEDAGFKETTTVPIRRAAFPRIAEWVDANSKHGYVHGLNFGTSGKFAESKRIRSSHFRVHVKEAARILGLIEE